MSESSVQPAAVFIPASRMFGLTQALLWAAASVVMAGLSFLVYSNLQWDASAGGNRLVQYSIALLASPLPLSALLCLATVFKWLSLAVWPQRIGLLFAPDRIAVTLALFRRCELDAKRLRIRYPFDFDEAAAAQMMEAQLPFEMQRSTLLPEMRHPDYKGRLKIDLLRFTKEEEPDLARRLGELFLFWHPLTPQELEEEEEDEEDRPQRRPWER